MEKLGIYCFFDKTNNIYFGFSTSSSDDVGAKFLVSETVNVVADLEKDKHAQDLFIANMSSCDVVRLGWINIENGSLKHDKCTLSTFQDFDFKKLIKKKIENDSEVSDNV